MMTRMNKPTSTMQYGMASAPKPVSSIVAPMFRPRSRIVLAVKQYAVTVATLHASSDERICIACISRSPIVKLGVAAS